MRERNTFTCQKLLRSRDFVTFSHPLLRSCKILGQPHLSSNMIFKHQNFPFGVFFTSFQNTIHKKILLGNNIFLTPEKNQKVYKIFYFTKYFKRNFEKKVLRSGKKMTFCLKLFHFCVISIEILRKSVTFS